MAILTVFVYRACLYTLDVETFDTPGPLTVILNLLRMAKQSGQIGQAINPPTAQTVHSRGCSKSSDTECREPCHELVDAAH